METKNCEKRLEMNSPKAWPTEDVLEVIGHVRQLREHFPNGTPLSALAEESKPGWFIYERDVNILSDYAEIGLIASLKEEQGSVKSDEEAASDYVLNEINPSDYVERAPDDLARQIFLAGCSHVREEDLRRAEEKIDMLKEALEFYATQQHFIFGGLNINEPETVSGEPTNFLCGGGEGNEYTYEDGWVAREALERIKS